MVEMRPNGHGTYGPRCIGPIGAGRRGVAEKFAIPPKPGNAGGGKGPQFKTDARPGEGPGDWVTYQIRRVFRNCRRCYTRKRRRLSRRRYLKPSALRLIAMGWRPPVGTIFLDGGVLDHFGLLLTKSCEPSDPAAADRVIGSCSFLLGGHGDLRIEWQEKDHVEIVKLLQAKMNAGVRFFILDPASLRWTPIKRAHRAMGREVYVRDPDIKKLIEAGFGRFPTTHFEGIGQIKILGIAKSAEEAARAVTIATPPPMRGGGADSLIGATAIADFLNRDLRVRPKAGALFTPRTVYNWAKLKKLLVWKLPNSTTLVTSKSALCRWLEDIGRGIDPTLR